MHCLLVKEIILLNRRIPCALYWVEWFVAVSLAEVTEHSLQTNHRRPPKLRLYAFRHLGAWCARIDQDVKFYPSG